MTSTTTTSIGFGAQVSASERAYYEGVFREFAGADGLINGSELKNMFDRFDALAFGNRGKRNATQQYCDRCRELMLKVMHWRHYG